MFANACARFAAKAFVRSFWLAFTINKFINAYWTNINTFSAAYAFISIYTNTVTHNFLQRAVLLPYKVYRLSGY